MNEREALHKILDALGITEEDVNVNSLGLFEGYIRQAAFAYARTAMGEVTGAQISSSASPVKNDNLASPAQILKHLMPMSAIIGAIQALKAQEIVTNGYLERMESYYIPELRASMEFFKQFIGGLTQGLERGTHNADVAGSIPAPPTNSSAGADVNKVASASDTRIISQAHRETHWRERHNTQDLQEFAANIIEHKEAQHKQKVLKFKYVLEYERDVTGDNVSVSKISYADLYKLINKHFGE